MNKKTFLILIILGIFIRLFISLTTYHQDLGAMAVSGKYIAGEGKWLNFYDAIASKDASGQMVVHRNDVVFNYQPLAYLIPSAVYLPFSQIVRNTGELFINRSWIDSQSSSFYFLLLLYKLPMLLADIGIILLVAKFFPKEKDRRLAQVLWALNPLAIFVSSLMGQVDIVIALFLLLSLYFYKNKRSYLSVVFISLSALIKPIGLILIPLIILHDFQNHKKITQSIVLGAIGVGTYIAGILPFIGSASYRTYALFAEQINKSTYAGISIASGHDIPFFFIFYILVCLLFWFKKISLRTALISALLSSLAFTHFHPQWLVWLMPLMILESIRKNEFVIYALSILCWFGVLSSFDETLHLQAFLHSKLAIPESVRSSSFFKEIIQLSRAGIVSLLVALFFTQKNSQPE